MSEEIKGLIEQQGAAFEAFKQTMTEGEKKRNASDVVVTEKLARIETGLDDAVEAKAAVEASLAAERKAREELELKVNRLGFAPASEAEAKRLVNLAEFNNVMAANAGDRKRAFVPFDLAQYDAYRTAQVKFIREGEKALTPDEVKTLSVGSDPDGGYFVTPDMSGRMAKKIFESSPVRQVASVQSIQSDALEGIEDTNEAGAGYAGEQAQGSDTTTPQIGKWRIPVYWIDTEPKATQQILDDASVDVERWLADKVADKIARFENAEFVTGETKIFGFAGAFYTKTEDTGSGVPWGEIGFVKTGASGAFGTVGGDNLIDLMGRVKNGYLSNAKWVTKRAVITLIRKFKGSATGDYFWQPSFTEGFPETIYGFPVVRMEDMPTVAASSYSVAFGDFGAAYQVVDRTGIRVLRDPFTSKPYVKFYTTKRTGGGVVNYEAIKLLKFIN